ncbi:acyl-CoA dehydrogenase family protein [Streptomyces sp. NPDC001822]|uniref:acyl-CoA dehydrogenase family protein n=1 Tax=Streptomyces sp. NPDC001822 TaxID=3364614 RepID=UPI0036900CDD
MTSLPSSVLERVHRDLVASFESFIRRELVPLAAEVPEPVDGPPRELRDYVRKRSAALGFYGAEYPERMGGAGMPLTALVQLHHAAGASGCALAPYALAGPDGPSWMLTHGTPEQIETYLVPMVRGEKLRCLAMTEPGSGSDAFTITTKAERDGDGWLLSGRKTFVSNAGHADYAIVIADVAESEHDAGGATAFIMPLDHPGLRRGQRYFGMAGEPLFELVLDQVRLPMSTLIGGEDGIGASVEFAMDSLAYGRLLVAAQCNGIAEYALRAGVEFAQQREAFGQVIGSYQHVQEHLVTGRAGVETAKLLTLACAELVEAGEDSGGENAALAKLVASQTAVDVVDRSLQVHGATGYVRGHPLEYLYRHVRMMTIIEGTSEVQKVIVARSMGLG